MGVSVPEKTLENWATQYLAYRYRAKASMWWPARGEDLTTSTPTKPGKLTLIEYKTSTVRAGGRHEVLVELGQLSDYLARRRSLRPFYAFPLPWWSDALLTSVGPGAWQAAYSRSGALWFARWMHIMTADEVGSVLSVELTRFRSSGAKEKKVPLVEVDATTGATIWAPDSSALPWLSTWRWLDFWPQIDRCGIPGWPGLVRVPRRLLPSGRRFSRAVVMRALADVASAPENFSDDASILLEPSDSALYEVVELIDPRTDDSARGTGESHGEQAVFIDASALIA